MSGEINKKLEIGTDGVAPRKTIGSNSLASLGQASVRPAAVTMQSSWKFISTKQVVTLQGNTLYQHAILATREQIDLT